MRKILILGALSIGLLTLISINTYAMPGDYRPLEQARKSRTPHDWKMGRNLEKLPLRPVRGNINGVFC